MDKIEELLKGWSDPLGANTMSDAEELIDLLRIERAGKEEVIRVLREDVKFYKRYQTEAYKNPPRRIDR
jgi:hypothetical protein